MSMGTLETIRAELDAAMKGSTRIAFAHLLYEAREMLEAFEEENDVRSEPRRTSAKAANPRGRKGAR